jgi:two-component system, NtrC family, response regulator HydG
MRSVNRAAALPPDLLRLVTNSKAAGERVRVPDMADLIGRLHFHTRDGRIWLDDQRMLLVRARALGSLQHEMIESLGIDVTRRLITRMGYQAGAHDARMARKVRSMASVEDMFLVGPQMHCLQGLGLSEAIRLEFNVERGSHYGEFVWTHQVEGEEPGRHFPIGAEPMCWMQIGYVSGFGTEFMGRPVLYREVECQSMGQAACRIVGKTVEEWGDDGVDDMRFLSAEKLTGGVSMGFDEPVDAAAMSAARSTMAPTRVDDVVGISPSFKAVCHMMRKVAPTHATVLFTGESGVGKEVFARMLHRLSARAGKEFVALNCAAIPDPLVESELFGVERGAFTGAANSRPGRFERADGGTLFLDEIGTLSTMGQGKLLRALQEREIERVGGTHTRKIDVRVIAATNVDLREEGRAGRFREDLFFRLNVFPIRIPPLRERREDIPLLMNHFLVKFTQRHGRRLAGFTPRALDAMLSYDWPGNIRELENVIERGVILGTERRAIDVQHLFTGGERFGKHRFGVGRDGKLVANDPLEFSGAGGHDRDVDRVSRGATDLLLGRGDGSDKVSLDEIETMLLNRAVERAQGNVSAAARWLGIRRPQMVYRLKSLERDSDAAVDVAEQPAFGT